MNNLKQIITSYYNGIEKLRQLDTYKTFFDVVKKAQNLGFSNQIILWNENIDFTHLETKYGWSKYKRYIKDDAKEIVLLNKKKRDKILNEIDYKDTEVYYDSRDTGYIYRKIFFSDVSDTIGSDEFKEFNLAENVGLVRQSLRAINREYDVEDFFKLMDTVVSNEILKYKPNIEKELYTKVRIASSMIVVSRLGFNIDNVYEKETFNDIFKRDIQTIYDIFSLANGITATIFKNAANYEPVEKVVTENIKIPKEGLLNGINENRSLLHGYLQSWSKESYGRGEHTRGNGTGTRQEDEEVQTKGERRNNEGDSADNNTSIYSSLPRYGRRERSPLQISFIPTSTEEERVFYTNVRESSERESSISINSTGERRNDIEKISELQLTQSEDRLGKKYTDDYRDNTKEIWNIQRSKTLDTADTNTSIRNNNERDDRNRGIEPTRRPREERASNERYTGEFQHKPDGNTVLQRESELHIKANKSEERVENTLSFLQKNESIFTEEESIPALEKLENNLKAIATLKKLEKGILTESDETREILSKYVGFGGISYVLDPKKEKYINVQNFLKKITTEDEYRELESSVLTAFYTPDFFIEEIYNTLERIGVKGGYILEPSMGIGKFIKNLPVTMNTSEIIGIEKDTITGKIAKYLYPNIKTYIKGFEDVSIEKNSLDVVVGNVPFGNFSVVDKEYKNNKLPIHDFFFRKSIDSLKNGGVLALITSTETLDKKNNSLKEYIDNTCKFLGAVRLPNKAFKSAGTETATDIIFLQKLDNYHKENKNYNLLKLEEFNNTGKTINSYFVNNPEMILGDVSLGTNQYGKVLKYAIGENLKDKLIKALAKIKNVESISKEFNKNIKNNEKEILAERENVLTDELSFNLAETKAQKTTTEEERDNAEVEETEEKQIETISNKQETVQGTILEYINEAKETTTASNKRKFNKDLSKTYILREESDILEELDIKNTREMEHIEKNYTPIILSNGNKILIEDNKVNFLKSELRQVLGEIEDLSGLIFTLTGDVKTTSYIVKRRIKYDEEELENLMYYKDIEKNVIWHKTDNYMVLKNYNGKKYKRVLGMMELSKITRDILKMEQDGKEDYEIIPYRTKLLDKYKEFNTNFNSFYERANRQVFSNDKYYPLLCSLERVSKRDKAESEKDKTEYVVEKLSDIFYKRTLYIENKKNADNVFDALNISMSERCEVDIDFMNEVSNIPKERIVYELESANEIFDDLSNSFFEDEELKIKESRVAQYVTKDVYLSGDVKKKLKIIYDELEKLEEYEKQNGTDIRSNAIKTKLENNLKSIETVIPKDISSEDLVININMRWIPQKIIQEFLDENIALSYTPRLLYSSFSGKYYYNDNNTVKNSHCKFSTSSVNGFILLQNVLNNTSTKIYKEIVINGKGKKIIDTKETMLARERENEIRSHFNSFINNKNYRPYLTDIYNDKFNRIVPRNYDTKNIKFHNMTIECVNSMREHQLRAIKRGLMGGNLLLAHTVGAGKTRIMIAIAMERKYLGLCNKPIIIVKKSTIEQFVVEFRRMYPTANLLVAGQNDFNKQNRKIFCSRIATGNYDSVIMTHEQFQKLPVSIESQKKIIEEKKQEIGNNMDILKSTGLKESLSFKELQKAYKNMEEKLKNLEGTKDDLISFEQTGCDLLINDESHTHKNLEVTTSLIGINGISKASSKRSFDMYQKTNYLNEKTNYNGIIFATGTPISNAINELYTNQKYLQPNLLEEYDCSNFDSWVHDFGEIREELELKPEGNGYQIKTKLSKYNNIPELMRIFKENTDIVIADELTDYISNLPTPHREVIKTTPSVHQKMVMEDISERAERIRNRQVDSKEDNFLLLTNDGRKLAIDIRLLMQGMDDYENSKINKLIENVARIHEENNEEKKTQVIFSDIGTPTGNTFNVYKDIKDKLVQKGVEKDEIAFIHDYETNARKKRLFDEFNSGKIRVLIGSTEKLGVGVNIQKKLIAMHNLDIPWRPSDLTQREGRILRQGNENKDIYIYNYVTEDTFDAYMWNKLENKQRFIGQIMTNSNLKRSIEDVDTTALNYAEIKGLCTSNPKIKEKIETENKLELIKQQKNAYLMNKSQLRKNIEINYPHKIEKIKDKIFLLRQDIENLHDIEEDKFKIILNKEIYTKKDEAVKALKKAIQRSSKFSNEEPVKGEYRGLTLEFYLDLNDIHGGIYVGKAKTDIKMINNVNIFTKIDKRLECLEEDIKQAYEDKEKFENMISIDKLDLDKPFSMEDELKRLEKRLYELQEETDLLKEHDIAQDVAMESSLEEEYTKNFEKILNSTEESEMEEFEEVE